MAGQEGLGRLFNVLPVADDVYVPLTNAAGVTFIGVLAAGDTWTLTSASDAAGTGAAVLPTITNYYTSETVGAAWVRRTQAAASTVVTTASQDVVAIYVNGSELPDGHTHVKVASTSTGTVVAIPHDLHVQRDPANLPALV